MTTTQSIIDRAESLLAGITEGEWGTKRWPSRVISADGATICKGDVCTEENATNITFIAASPELVRGLVEEVKRLRELVSTAYPFVLTHCAEWSYRHGLPDGEYHPTHKAILDAAQKVFAEVNK